MLNTSLKGQINVYNCIIDEHKRVDCPKLYAISDTFLLLRSLSALLQNMYQTDPIEDYLMGQCTWCQLTWERKKMVVQIVSSASLTKQSQPSTFKNFLICEEKVELNRLFLNLIHCGTLNNTSGWIE